jgi:hypothetical protein
MLETLQINDEKQCSAARRRGHRQLLERGVLTMTVEPLVRCEVCMYVLYMCVLKMKTNSNTSLRGRTM